MLHICLYLRTHHCIITRFICEDLISMQCAVAVAACLVGDIAPHTCAFECSTNTMGCPPWKKHVVFKGL